MKGIFLKFLVLDLILAIFVGCISTKRTSVFDAIQDPIVLDNKLEIIYVPAKEKAVPFLVYEKNTKYLLPINTKKPLKKDFIVNNNMRNVEFYATIEKKGKVIRRVDAQKTQETVLGTKNNAWSTGKSKLSVVVPYVNDNEEVVIHSKFEWMDIRWLFPLKLEEFEYTKNALLVLEVPHGVTMHFQATQFGNPLEFLPKSTNIEKQIWADIKQKTGLGTRHEFSFSNKANYNDINIKNEADLLQVFLSFETAFSLDTNIFFDSWDKVSYYLYNKIDRFDAPNAAITEFTKAKVKDIVDVKEKVATIFGFLKNNIENRSMEGGYQNQEVQPGSRTFQRKMGSFFDIAILGKAMFASINIESQLLAVNNKLKNPNINFFSPSLFYDVILMVNTKEGTYYFDPNQNYQLLHQLPPHLQGQQALLLSENNGYVFRLPYDLSDKHQKSLEFEISLQSKHEKSSGFGYGLFSGFYEQDLSLNAVQNLVLGKTSKIKIGAIQEQENEEGTQKKIAMVLDEFDMEKNEDNLEFSIYPFFSFLENALNPKFSNQVHLRLKINLPKDYMLSSGLKAQSFNEGGLFLSSLIMNEADVLLIEVSLMAQMPLGAVNEILVKNFIENFKKPLLFKKLQLETLEQNKEPVLEEENKNEIEPEEIFESP